MPTSLIRTEVLIIGGGATGTGLARDLALRAVPALLVEQHDLDAGASGANHGLLHSGGRYVSNDPESATHCHEENALLRRLAPHCVEPTGGLFVAVEGDDERFIAEFPSFCARCGVPCRALGPADARAIEPALSPRVIAAYEVGDATVDPFKLAIENATAAKRAGATVRSHARVVGFDRHDGRIRRVRLRDGRSGEELTVEPTEVVNAAGAWSGEVAKLAGLSLDIVYSKGTLVITQARLTSRVVNRLRKPSNADIVVPGGTVSVLGTTSVRLEDLGDIRPSVDEVETILDETTAMIPAIAEARIIRAYAGVRPLVRQGTAGDDRAVSRDLTLIDHARDGVANFVTVTGGKLTTYRSMAEKAADLVCAHLGVKASGRTHLEPLAESAVWTVPGRAPLEWLERAEPSDPLLCGCELVPASAVGEIAAAIARHPTLKEIGLRSRVGKGACQGTFCSYRVLGRLYDDGRLGSADGLDDLRAFLAERWKGERPVLFGTQLRQAELKEAIHCALFGLEL